MQAAKNKGTPVRVGNIFSADLFYTPDPSMFDVMEKYGILGVEMEAAGVGAVAGRLGLPFYCIRAVSDLAEEDLRNDFNSAFRSDGSLDTMRLLGSGVRRPAARPCMPN